MVLHDIFDIAIAAGVVPIKCTRNLGKPAAFESQPLTPRHLRLLESTERISRDGYFGCFSASALRAAESRMTLWRSVRATI